MTSLSIPAQAEAAGRYAIRCAAIAQAEKEEYERRQAHKRPTGKTRKQKITDVLRWRDGQSVIEIHDMLPEMRIKPLRTALCEMEDDGIVRKTGVRGNLKYWLVKAS